MYTKICANDRCGITFHTNRVIQKYCNSKCANRAGARRAYMKQEPLRIALRNMREEVRQLRRVAMLDFAKRHNLTPGPIPKEHWIEFNELIQEYSILLHKRELEVRKWFNELR